MARRSGERKTAKSERKGRARSTRKAAGSGEERNYRRKPRAKRLAPGKNSGCAPKLSALLLFAAAGAFFFLRS